MIRRIGSRPFRRGVAALEAALLVPLVLFLLLGVWEVGRMANVSQIINNAAREGARQAATGLLTNVQVQQAVLNYLNNAGIPTQNATVTVTDLTNSGTDATQATQMDQMQVTITLPFEDVSWTKLDLVTNASTQYTVQATWLSVKDQSYPTTLSAPPGF
jgi:Flp pilus assembly protein TadG